MNYPFPFHFVSSFCSYDFSLGGDNISQKTFMDGVYNNVKQKKETLGL